MKLVLLYITLALVVAKDVPIQHLVSVEIGSHQHLRINNPDPHRYSVSIQRVMVCSNEKKDAEKKQTRIETSKGCETDGFIQYAIPTKKNDRVFHPHVDRVTTDHYYTQVHLNILDKQTGKVIEDTCLVKVHILRRDITSITLGILSLMVITVFAYIAVYRRKQVVKKSVNEQTKNLVQNMDLYAFEIL